MGATPNVWFKNPRILKIIKELNLIQSMHISLNSFTHMGGEIVAKIKVLEQVIGSDIIIPLRKKLRIMSKQARLYIDIAKALQINGLITREDCRQ